MSEYLFTIITITYNSSQWVKQAIESVLTSDFTDFEYLISDDASTDNTWEIVQSYKNEPRIKYFRHEKNIGEYSNRNFCLNHAKGKYLLFIDGDDILYNGSLSLLAKYTQEFPMAGAFWGVPVMDIVVFPYELKKEEITKLIFLSNYHIANIGFAESIFNTKALLEVGGFDESFVIGDNYIKKRIACTYPVVLTSKGYSFWRQTSNQASRKAMKDFSNLIQEYQINLRIVNSSYFPLSEEDKLLINENTKTSIIKLLVVNTLLKGKPFAYLQLLRKTGLSIWDITRVFKKINKDYSVGVNGNNPLMNNYNFK